jgi:hypothetical protein
VPLIIAHPHSPYCGRHYPYPVELVDIYPTLVDLLGLNVTRAQACAGWECRQLDGHSLAPAVLGTERYRSLQVDRRGPAKETEDTYSVGTVSKRLAHRVKKLFHQAARGDDAGCAAPPRLPKVDNGFAVTQVLRCAPRALVSPPTLALLGYKSPYWTSRSTLSADAPHALIRQSNPVAGLQPAGHCGSPPSSA